MLRLITHIEHLLLAHDCVIIPQFGGFVLQSLPSVHQVEKHLFHPMRKEIVFNITLQHTDGLLSESYMQTYGVSYRKARLMLEEDTEELESVLERDKTVEFGKMGSFSLGEEGQVVFMPAETDSFNADCYGLQSFSFPPLPPLVEEREEVALLTGKKRKDVFYIPVSRKLIRVAAASVAAVALFLVVSTPVAEVNPSAYTASFVPTEMMNYRFEESSRPQVDRLVPETMAPEPVVEAPVVETPAPAPVAKKAKEAPVAVKKKKMYHIVIASFPTEAQADEYMAGVDRGQCKRVSKVVRDGKYRIYADKYDNREEAESFMATLRKQDKYKDAWLYISQVPN